MVKVPHERGDLEVPLINERQNVGFFHNGFSVRMVISSCDDSQSLFLQECDVIEEPLVSKAPHRESIC